MAETKRTLLERIDANIKALLARFQPGLLLRFGPVATRGNLPQGPQPMALTLTDIQHVPASIQEVDAAGNPTTTAFDSPPVWSTSDDTILTVTPSADGTSADIATTGKLGNAQVKVEAVNDKGEPVTALGDIIVTTSASTTVGITFGTPVDK